MDARTTAAIDDIIARLREAGWKERDGIKAELLAAAKADADFAGVREKLEGARKDLILELRWEIDEVIEAITPPPVPPPKKEEEPPPVAEKKQLSAADLNLVYDDPRGLMLYKTKKLPERWFATQVDPRTGQPQTFELHANEVAQLKTQLTGSPYWVLGAGGAATT
jgi:hypothetical protein